MLLNKDKSTNKNNTESIMAYLNVFCKSGAMEIYQKNPKNFPFLA